MGEKLIFIYCHGFQFEVVGDPERVFKALAFSDPLPDAKPSRVRRRRRGIAPAGHRPVLQVGPGFALSYTEPVDGMAAGVVDTPTDSPSTTLTPPSATVTELDDRRGQVLGV